MVRKQYLDGGLFSVGARYHPQPRTNSIALSVCCSHTRAKYTSTISPDLRDQIKAVWAPRNFVLDPVHCPKIPLLHLILPHRPSGSPALKPPVFLGKLPIWVTSPLSSKYGGGLTKCVSHPRTCVLPGWIRFQNAPNHVRLLFRGAVVSHGLPPLSPLGMNDEEVFVVTWLQVVATVRWWVRDVCIE